MPLSLAQEYVHADARTLPPPVPGNLVRDLIRLTTLPQHTYNPTRHIHAAVVGQASHGTATGPAEGMIVAAAKGDGAWGIWGLV